MMNAGSRASATPDAGKIESRLSILALLAPSSPDSPPQYDYLGPQHQNVSTTPSVLYQDLAPTGHLAYQQHHHQQQQLQHAEQLHQPYPIVRAQSPPPPPQPQHNLYPQDANVKPAKLLTIAPRPSDQISRPPPANPTPRQSSSSVPRRIATIVACENCRAKRTKCDGARPKCSRCVRLGTGCEYDAGPDETRSVARKRKYEEMRNDLNDMQELVDYMRVKPLPDVAEVIRRIRAGEDPCRVLSLLRDGDLLLQASALGRQELEFDKDDAIKKLDEAAMQKSHIKVAAKPWTAVGGDGLVSELVSIFFDTEQPFSTAYVDRFCFLEDLKSGKPEKARFCSPALVNSICALGAFTSDTAKAIDLAQGGNIREAFYAEAKRQLDLEHGKDSVTTTMVLITLFLYASAAGIDRAGGPHRLTACTMYKRLKMGTDFPTWVNKLQPPARDRACKALSRAAWGIFCLESISSFVYIQPALIEPPTLPRIFDGNREDVAPEDPDCPDPFLDAECGMSSQLYHIMCYNRESRFALGNPDDISARLSHYQKLMGWTSQECTEKGRGLTGLAQSIFLQAYFSIAVIALFRPLAPLDLTLPNGLGSAGTFVVQHCKRMVERLQEFEQRYPEESGKGCVGTLYFYYVVSISLVSLLDKERDSHEPFIQACRHFHLVSKNFGVGRAVLRGLQAMALEMQVHLPEQSLSYFAEASLAEEHFNDVPVSYVVPGRITSKTGAPGEDDDGSDAEVHLGNLIEKWSAVSVNK